MVSETYCIVNFLRHLQPLIWDRHLKLGLSLILDLSVLLEEPMQVVHNVSRLEVQTLWF